MTETVGEAARAYTITAEVLDAAAFEPFGTVLTKDESTRLPHSMYGDRIETYRPAVIDASQPLEWFFCFSRVRAFNVRFLERHHELAQAFIPLGAAPFVSVVAAPDCVLESEVPAFDSVHAFIVPGDVGIQLHRGTWHEPPFPLVDGSCTLITSHRRLSEGLAQPLDERGEIRQLDVDKRNVTERTGVLLRVQLP